MFNCSGVFSRATRKTEIQLRSKSAGMTKRQQTMRNQRARKQEKEVTRKVSIITARHNIMA